MEFLQDENFFHKIEVLSQTLKIGQKTDNIIKEKLLNLIKSAKPKEIDEPLAKHQDFELVGSIKEGTAIFLNSDVDILCRWGLHDVTEENVKIFEDKHAKYRKSLISALRKLDESDLGTINITSGGKNAIKAAYRFEDFEIDVDILVGVADLPVGYLKSQRDVLFASCGPKIVHFMRKMGHHAWGAIRLLKLLRYLHVQELKEKGVEAKDIEKADLKYEFKLLVCCFREKLRQRGAKNDTFSIFKEVIDFLAGIDLNAAKKPAKPQTEDLFGIFSARDQIDMNSDSTEYSYYENPIKLYEIFTMSEHCFKNVDWQRVKSRYEYYQQIIQRAKSSDDIFEELFQIKKLEKAFPNDFSGITSEGKSFHEAFPESYVPYFKSRILDFRKNALVDVTLDYNARLIKINGVPKFVEDAKSLIGSVLYHNDLTAPYRPDSDFRVIMEESEFGKAPKFELVRYRGPMVYLSKTSFIVAPWLEKPCQWRPIASEVSMAETKFGKVGSIQEIPEMMATIIEHIGSLEESFDLRISVSVGKMVFQPKLYNNGESAVQLGKISAKTFLMGKLDHKIRTHRFLQSIRKLEFDIMRQALDDDCGEASISEIVSLRLENGLYIRLDVCDTNLIPISSYFQSKPLFVTALFSRDQYDMRVKLKKFEYAMKPNLDKVTFDTETLKLETGDLKVYHWRYEKNYMYEMSHPELDSISVRLSECHDPSKVSKFLFEMEFSCAMLDAILKRGSLDNELLQVFLEFTREVRDNLQNHIDLKTPRNF